LVFINTILNISRSNFMLYTTNWQKIKNTAFQIFIQSVCWCTVSIIVFHLFPDMIMHSDIQVFSPFSNVTFVEPSQSGIYGGYPTNLTRLRLVTRIFIYSGYIGIILFLCKYLIHKTKAMNPPVS
jgi:hypothetical protein